MASSSEDIERTDFPRVPDGYDPEAVADHLRAVAGTIAELRAATARSSGGRVQAIVDAAERSAAELEESARADAEQVRAEAHAELERAVGAAAGIEERVAAVTAELERLRDRLRDTAAAPGAAPAPAGEKAPAPPPEEAPAEAEQQHASAGEEPAPEEEQQEQQHASAGEEPAPAGGEAARVIALNMMLDGASREDVSRYLEQNFDLEEPGEFLDEVWRRAEA
jgi:DivIVA domain-containing protein